MWVLNIIFCNLFSLNYNQIRVTKFKLWNIYIILHYSDKLFACINIYCYPVTRKKNAIDLFWVDFVMVPYWLVESRKHLSLVMVNISYYNILFLRQFWSRSIIIKFTICWSSLSMNYDFTLLFKNAIFTTGLVFIADTITIFTSQYK